MARHQPGVREQAQQLVYVYWALLALESFVAYSTGTSLFVDVFGLEGAALTAVYAVWFVSLIVTFPELIGRLAGR